MRRLRSSASVSTLPDARLRQQAQRRLHSAHRPPALQPRLTGAAAHSQGLALPSLSKASGGRPGFWRMLDLGLLDTPMFSLWLNPDVSEVAAGEIRFGGASVDRQDGPLVELPVVSDKCAPGCGPVAAALLLSCCSGGTCACISRPAASAPALHASPLRTRESRTW